MLEPGQTVRGGGQDYRIEGKVGQGRTALVYAAVPTDPTAEIRRVAVKLRLPGLDQELKRMFEGERENLLRLQNDLQAAPYIPHFYGGGTTTANTPTKDGDYFLIEDFVSAPAADDLLARDGALPEEEVMLIGKQFTAVLAGLHGLGHTYTDMKLENIHWDKPQQRITVTDWNVIGIYDLTGDEGKAQFEANKRRDLLRFAGFLYQLATGEPIASTVGLTAAQQQQSTAFQALAEHTQWLLAKALHPNAEQRFTNATEMGEELGRWQQSDDELADIALEKQLAATNDSYEYEYRLLQLAQRRSDLHGDLLDPLLADMLGPAAERYAEIQQKRETNADIVRRYYVAGNLEVATARAAEALKDDPNDLAVWRWQQALELERTLGSQFTLALRETLETIIKNLNKDLWITAAQSLGVDPDPQHPSQIHTELKALETQLPIVYLSNDAIAMLQYDHAQHLLTAGNLDAADQAMQLALAAQHKLPGAAQGQRYQDATRLITGDIEAQIDALREHRDHSVQVTRLLKEAAARAPQQHEEEEILKLVRAAHGRDSDGVAVRDWCLAHAKEVLLAHSDNRDAVLFAHDLLALARSTRAATREVAEWEQWARQLGWVFILRDRQGAAVAYDELKRVRLHKPNTTTDDEAQFWDNVTALTGQLRQAACAALLRKIDALKTKFGAAYNDTLPPASDTDTDDLQPVPNTDAVLTPIIAQAVNMRDMAATYLADEQAAASTPQAADQPATSPSPQAVVDQFDELIEDFQKQRITAYYEGLHRRMLALGSKLAAAIHAAPQDDAAIHPSPSDDAVPPDPVATITLDRAPTVYNQVLQQVRATEARLIRTAKPILDRLQDLEIQADTPLAQDLATSEEDTSAQEQIHNDAAQLRKSYEAALQSFADRENALVVQQETLETQRKLNLQEAETRTAVDLQEAKIHEIETAAAAAAVERARYEARRRWEAERRLALTAACRNEIDLCQRAYGGALDKVASARDSGLLQAMLEAHRLLCETSGLDVIGHTYTLLVKLWKVHFADSIADPVADSADRAQEGSSPDFLGGADANQPQRMDIPPEQTVLTGADVVQALELITQQRKILHTQAVNDAFLLKAEQSWREHEQLEIQRATLSNQPDQEAENLARDQQILEELIQEGRQYHFTGYNTVDQFRDLLTDVAAHKEVLAAQLQQQAGHTQTLDRVGLLLAGSYPDTSATKDGP